MEQNISMADVLLLWLTTSYPAQCQTPTLNTQNTSKAPYPGTYYQHTYLWCRRLPVICQPFRASVFPVKVVHEPVVISTNICLCTWYINNEPASIPSFQRFKNSLPFNKPHIFLRSTFHIVGLSFNVYSYCYSSFRVILSILNYLMLFDRNCICFTTQVFKGWCFGVLVEILSKPNRPETGWNLPCIFYTLGWVIIRVSKFRFQLLILL